MDSILSTILSAFTHNPIFVLAIIAYIVFSFLKSSKTEDADEYETSGAEKTWEEFFLRINRAMNFIQPLVFIFVALVIVLLYAAMLLPIYQNMEVHL